MLLFYFTCEYLITYLIIHRYDCGYSNNCIMIINTSHSQIVAIS